MKRKRVLPLCLGALFVAVPAMSQEKSSITLGIEAGFDLL